MRGGLRFAMITTFYPPYHFGGDGYYVYNLAAALTRKGHEVEVIHDVDAFRALHEGSEPEPSIEIPGTKVHGLESRFPALACLATHQSGRPLIHGRRIRRILGQGDFDVIHYHNVSLLGGPGVLAYGSGIKLYTIHEHWLVCPTHLLWRHNREVCTGRQCLRCVIRYRRPPQVWRKTGLLKRKSRYVDAFCSPSRFTAAKHREFGFHRQITVLPSFLPNSDIQDESVVGTDESNVGRPYFLFVGRLEQVKGVQEIIPLFGNNAPADLCVVGSGKYEEQLRQFAERYPRVRFLGSRKQNELRPIYAGAIALIAPSICYEVFPMVVMEAFREKTPVLARDIGPYPEIIQQSGGGLLFKTNKELEQALEQLVYDRQQRRRLGVAGWHAFNTYWTESAALPVYFELIHSIARKKGRTRIIEALGQAK